MFRQQPFISCSAILAFQLQCLNLSLVSFGSKKFLNFLHSVLVDFTILLCIIYSNFKVFIHIQFTNEFFFVFIKLFLENIKIENEKNNYKPQPVKENVAFDDFMKVDIRVGTVLECFKVPKADKLLQFKIDDGMGGRTIVSGIAKYYTEPEKLVGTQVCFIANFEPRKLKGVVSEGMILSAEDADGRLVLLQPRDLVKCGVKVG